MKVKAPNHEDIPDKAEMAKLRPLFMAGDPGGTLRFLRGAAYYGAQEVYGFSQQEAYQIALDEDLANVQFRVVKV